MARPEASTPPPAKEKKTWGTGEGTGRMVVTLTGEDTAFVILGACTLL